MSAIAEVIGYVAIFVFGLAACFYGGLLATLMYRDRYVRGSEGLSDMALGLFAGGAIAALYIGACIIWLAVT